MEYLVCVLWQYSDTFDTFNNLIKYELLFRFLKVAFVIILGGYGLLSVVELQSENVNTM